MLFLLIIVGGLVVFLRSSYVSGRIFSVLSGAVSQKSDLRLSGGAYYINPFPLYVGAADISLLDSSDNMVVSIERVKVYIDIAGALSGRISTRRVVLERPVVVYGDSARALSLGTGGEGADREGRDWRGVVIIRSGDMSFVSSDDGPPLMMTGIDAELSRGESLWALFSIGNLRYDIPGQKWPVINSSIKGRMKYDDHDLEIDALSAFLGASVVRAGGSISGFGTGNMRGELDVSSVIEVSSLEKPFDLKRNTGGEIRAGGTVSLGSGIDNVILDLDLSGDFHLETLLDALRSSASDMYSGRIEGNGYLRGPLSDLRGKVDAAITDSRVQGISIESASAMVTYSDEILGINEGSGHLYNGTADFDISFAVKGHRPFGLDVNFRDVDSLPVLERIGIGSIGLPDGKVTGELHSGGLHFSPEGWVRYHGGIRRDTPLGRMNFFSGRFRTEGEALMLEGFDLRSSSTNVSFDGHVDLKGPGLGFSGYAVTTDLTDILYPYDYGLRGSGRFEVNVTGTKRDPSVKISSSIWESSFRGHRLGSVELMADYSRELLRINKLRAAGGESSHTAEGQISFPGAEHIFKLKDPVFDLKASAAGASLESLVGIFVEGVDVMGRADTDVVLKGRLDALDLKGHADILDAYAYGRRIDAADISYYLKGGKLGVEKSRLSRGSARVDMSGYWSRDGSYETNLRAKDTPLSYIFNGISGADFSMNADLSGKGSVADPYFRLEADLLKGNIMNVPARKGRISATIEGGMVNASAGLMDDNLLADGTMRLGAEFPWSADLRLKYDRYDHILRYFARSIPDDVILAMGGSISLNGDREHVNAGVRLKRANVTAYGQGFANLGPFEVDVTDRRIDFKKVSMRGAHAKFDLSGSVRIGSELDMGIKADLSLLPFARFIPSVSQMRGNSMLDIRLRGPWNSPGIDGSIDLKDASVALRDIPQRLSALNASVTIENGTAKVKHASAKVGGGEINVSGGLALEGFRIEDMNLEAQIDNVSARMSTHFNVDLNGYLLLSGNSGRQNLSGEVAVLSALYRDKIDWGAMLLGGGREVPKGDVKWKDEVWLNVRLYGHDNIWIDNNLANAPLRGDLFVRGTLANPELSGRLEAIGGKVFFRNTELNIVRATADYTDAPLTRPVLDISARTDIRGYEIWLSMQGQADRMDLDMVSDPPLEDGEILALLTYGDIGSGYGALESGLGAAEAAAVVAGEIGLTQIMEERGTLYTGLDRIQIDPYLSRSTGSVTPRLTVSKKLLEDKLYLTYASTLDAASEKEVKLEYLFDENVSIVGGQDYTGSVGGDLKFRFRFE